jgi:hypothetical protein
MAGSFANEGAVDFWKGALATTPPPAGIPQTANLVTEAWTPGPGTTFASLVWANGVYAMMLRSGWTVAVNTGGNYVSAVQTVTWNFPPSAAGLTFYGVGTYDPLVRELFYSELFPAPYVVPATGSVLQWTFSLLFGNCGSVP